MSLFFEAEDVLTCGVSAACLTWVCCASPWIRTTLCVCPRWQRRFAQTRLWTGSDPSLQTHSAHARTSSSSAFSPDSLAPPGRRLAVMPVPAAPPLRPRFAPGPPRWPPSPPHRPCQRTSAGRPPRGPWAARRRASC